MKKRIAMIIGAGAVAVAAVAGGTQAGRADGARATDGVQLEWGTGAPPRYVATNLVSASQHVFGRGPLHRLRWGTGGPPELVPLDTH